MRFLGVFFGVLLLVSGAIFAQDAPPDAEPTYRSLSVVESVALVHEPEMPVVVIQGTLPTGCSYPVQISKTRTDVALFVDVYQDIPAAVMCPMMVLPFEIRVPVLELITADAAETLPQYLIINDQNFGVNQGELTASETPYLSLNLTPLDYIATSAETVTYEAVDGKIHLVVTGHIGDGCTDPILSRWTRETADTVDVVIMLSLFRLLDNPQECPQTFAAVPFEERIVTNIPSQYAVIAISGEQRFPREIVQTDAELPPLEPIPTGIHTMKVPHVIQKVDYRILESSPMQIHVEVTGYQADGCNVPVQVMQQRVGNSIKIEIYRELPPDVMCPQVIQDYSAIIPLSGTFESGSYSLDVNGTTVTMDV